MKQQPVILKLVSGEEIMAMYIKSKLFTVEIKNPVELVSDGDIMNPKSKLMKFSLYGNWDHMSIKKSAIAAIIIPVPEMKEYYPLITTWITNHLNVELSADLQRDINMLNGFMDLDTGEIAKSPESKEALYTHILETCHFPEGPIH